LFRKSVEFPNVRKVESGRSESRDRGSGWSEVGPFSHQVYHVHYYIIPMGFWEFHNKC
jgi:hypothetical protein